MRTIIRPNTTFALRYSFLIALIFLVIDRILKVLAQRIPPVVADFSFFSISFQQTKTTTILGFLPLGSTASVLLTGTVLIALLLWTFKNYSITQLLNYPYLAFILLGGASNLFDRLTTGAVTDVFRLAVGSSAVVFNLSDGMILVGIVSLIRGTVKSK